MSTLKLKICQNFINCTFENKSTFQSKIFEKSSFFYHIFRKYNILGVYRRTFKQQFANVHRKYERGAVP